MQAKLFGAFALLIAGAVAFETSTFKEVHPNSSPCANKCYGKYMGEDKESKTKCDACCAGCRYLSMIGLTEVNDEIKKETAKSGCYATCDEAKQDKESCRAGCDIELGMAEVQLEEMDKNFEDMDRQMSNLGNLFNNFFGALPSLISFEPVQVGNQGKEQPKWIPIGQGSPVVQVVELQPVNGNGQEGAGKEVVQDDAEMDLVNLLKEMGILEDEKPMSRAQEHRSSYPELSHHQAAGLSQREEGGGGHMAYFRGMWQDRNTMQVLLIASITACLFAILWMLCNSSNDPVVRRVTPHDPETGEKPPSYNVIYGQDEKKFPILVVAGIEDQAGPLPQKVPLGGLSTQI